ncbi:spore germination protein, putative [Heliomicrobium modesticaldum Ice1]|uniref:Spore germination protein, putative n=1 Tax=Heliobacterium modesticaldum (strain ATCC 51547 / Ice1) TaxID=498761 RepID=B0TFH6_HELMI|nr:GerMN domain-containing protein [Heliomicrobium modesticaldum]ABZ83075.1 spore germination protein, putative [Heliomicrobium modesticaldum Ice1]
MDRERSWSAGIILVVTALVIAFGLGGCSAVDRFISMKDDFKAKETGAAKQEQLGKNEQPVTQGQALPVDGQATVDPPPGPEQAIMLYFADAKGQNLVVERRSIPKTGSIAKAAVNELIKGPSIHSGALPTIPTGTRLIDINIKDGLCTVNLSKELQKNHQGGSASEALTVYSIVNTLTQFQAIQKVQLLVEGKKIETLAGHMDVSQAMARKNSMIAKEGETAQKASGETQKGGADEAEKKNH